MKNHRQYSGRAGLEARLELAEPPVPADRYTTKHATCAAHEDGAGGYAVLCKLDRSARSVRAVNITGARPLEGAWIAPPEKKGGDVVARLDLPYAPGAAEARAITYVNGLTGHVLRAEAVFAAGEAPSLLIHTTSRAQPTPAFPGAPPPRRDNRQPR